MSPVTASLRVAHQGRCAVDSQTSLASLERCTCKPSYYTFHRGGANPRTGNATIIKGKRVRNRRVADAMLRKLQVEIDEGRAEVKRPDARTFSEWSDEYLRIIEQGGRKASTTRAYEQTIAYASDAFGATLLREVGAPDLRRMVEAVRKNKSGDATVSKHLRQLGAIFSAAVDEGLIRDNPVPRFTKSLKLRVPKGDEPYTDEELTSLFAKMQALKVEAVYIAIVKAAVTTGARIGALIAADWGDLSLTGRTLRIRRTYDHVTGTLTTPKDSEERTAYLTDPAVKAFSEWATLANVAEQPQDAPIFPAPRSHGRLNSQWLRKVVVNATEKAGISDTGPNGRDRKPLHALRATYTRLMLEQGRNPQWVMEQLGHSDANLTLNIYGQWSEVAKHAEAAKVGANTFPGL